MWEEVKMVDTISGTIELIGLEGKVETYEILGLPIGTGTTGVAYKVRGKSNNEIYAAKEYILNEPAHFLDDAKYNCHNHSLHFVRIFNYGNATIIENSLTRTHPLSIMEYGGSNLLRVVEFLRKHEKVLERSKNAKKAFEYKVLYTLLEGILAVHKRKEKGWHRDLVPTNILCGFDLSDVVKQNETTESIDVALLEKKLIYGQVRLCDSSPSGKVGSLPSMKMGNLIDFDDPRDRELYRHLFREEDDSQKQDITALVGYLWWFLGGKAKSPSNFTGIVKAYNDEGELAVSIAEILTGVEKKCAAEKTLIKQRAGKGNDSSPLILRPVDAFRKEFGSQTLLSTSAGFNSMYKDAEYSYEKMLKLNEEEEVHADEQKALQNSLKEFALASVISIHNKYQQKLGACLEPSKKRDALGKKLEKKGKEKETLEAKLSLAKSKATDTGDTSIKDIEDDNKFMAYSYAREAIKALSTQLDNLCGEITTKERELVGVKSELSEYDYKRELDALKVASDRCPPAIFVGEFKEVMDYLNPNLSPPQQLSAAEVAQRCRKIITTKRVWEKVENLLPKQS